MLLMVLGKMARPSPGSMKTAQEVEGQYLHGSLFIAVASLFIVNQSKIEIIISLILHKLIDMCMSTTFYIHSLPKFITVHQL